MSTDELVFRALADPTRRFLLDELFRNDGQSLVALEARLDMTRFGVAKHLRVLEEAGLVVARRSGREKLHFLNPVPIRLVHDRWIDKYTERRAAALVQLKSDLEHDMTSAADENIAEDTRTVNVFRVYIKAAPQAIWDAITQPEWTVRFGYQAPVRYDLRPGGSYTGYASDAMKAQGAPDVVIDGEVVEVDPPRRLVQTWRALYLDEDFTRLTYEIEEEDGVSILTVTHDVSGAPLTAAQTAGEMPNAGGGWNQILSDLKTLLETGRAMYPPEVVS